jgi:hypothetical protein
MKENRMPIPRIGENVYELWVCASIERVREELARIGTLGLRLIPHEINGEPGVIIDPDGGFASMEDLQLQFVAAGMSAHVRQGRK